jgi:general secretion pathway protein M
MNALLTKCRALWAPLAPSTQRQVAGASLVVLLLAVWLIGIQPALRTLASSAPEQQRLDAQLSQMQALAAQVSELKSKPQVTAQQASNALGLLVKSRLGATATVELQGEQAHVSFKAVSGETLAQFLAQARANAASTPLQTHLTQASPSAGPVLWSGSLALRLPAAP